MAAAAPKGLLAASPKVKVEVDEGVVVVVAPKEVVADPAAAFGCPKVKDEFDAVAAAPKVAEAVVAAAAAVVLPVTLDPKEKEDAPLPPLPKEKVGAAVVAEAAAVVVAAGFPKEKDGVPVALAAVTAAVASLPEEPKEKPPPPPGVVFPKVNAAPEGAGAAATDVVVAGDDVIDPNEKDGVADVEVVFAAVVVFACPKLNEGAAGVRLVVVDAVLELLPNENEAVFGWVGVALAVVFAWSNAAAEPNEKLATGATGAPPSVVFPKVNAEPDDTVEAAVEVVDVVVVAEAEDVPNEND